MLCNESDQVRDITKVTIAERFMYNIFEIVGGNQCSCVFF